MFACEHAEVVPDIMCIGKGLERRLYDAGGGNHFAKSHRNDFARRSGRVHARPDVYGEPAGVCRCLRFGQVAFVPRLAGKYPPHRKHPKGRLKTAWDIRGVKDVRVLGTIGVIELEKGVDMARFQADCVAQGIWVRPFGRLVYLMPPYIISDDLLTELADKTVQILKEHSK